MHFAASFQRFEHFIPLIWLPVFVLCVRFCHVINARVSSSKERAQVILECLLVGLSESFCKSDEERLGFDFVFFNSVLELFLCDELLLDLRFECAVDEDARPLDFIHIDVSSFSTHEIVLPLAFV